ncbi:MAG: 50S ribosomal protein L16 [Candidatus Hodarchaeales archaeon]|jgi:large subunit ribosomal protein L10e
MARRPARCYAKQDRPPYTRRKFIRGGPEPKIKIFDLGSPGKDFSVTLGLMSQKKVQISHNALEAARIQVNRFLNESLGRENYHYKICVFPHHIIRENKMMTGAGADRVQDGMRKAFGKPIGSTARVKKGQKILQVRVDAENFKIAKDALRRAKPKFPTTSKILVLKGEELLPT